MSLFPSIRTPKTQDYLFPFILVSLLILSILILSGYLGIIVFAVVLAIVSYPLKKALSRGIKNEFLSSSLTILITGITVLLPLATFGFVATQEVISSVRDLIQTGALAGVISNVEVFINNLLPAASAWVLFDADVIINMLNLANIRYFAINTFTFFLQFFIWLILYYYFLKDGKFIVQKIIDYSPLGSSVTERFTTKTKSVVDSIVKGDLIIAFAQGTATAVGFFLFGIPNIFLWGTLSAIVSLIPGVGSILVLVGGSIYLFFVQANVLLGLGLLLWGIFIVSGVDNILRPKIISRYSALHPILVIIGILGGIKLFGASGLILGPLILAWMLLSAQVYKEKLEESKII